MGSVSWWIKISVIGGCSVLFLIFGIEVLIGAYTLKHPQLFIMYFFSGCFISLISLIGIIYPFVQIYEFIYHHHSVREHE